MDQLSSTCRQRTSSRTGGGHSTGCNTERIRSQSNAFVSCTAREDGQWRLCNRRRCECARACYVAPQASPVCCLCKRNTKSRLPLRCLSHPSHRPSAGPLSCTTHTCARVFIRRRGSIFPGGPRPLMDHDQFGCKSSLARSVERTNRSHATKVLGLVIDGAHTARSKQMKC